MHCKRIKGGVTAPKGFSASGIHAGIKPSPQLDLAIISSDCEGPIAGVFTKNRIQAAPVLLCRQKIKNPIGKAIIVNSGNANACTGRQGLQDAKSMTLFTAKALKIPPAQVFVGSTGIIGHPFPLSQVQRAIPSLVARIRQAGHQEAAKAIMTTDTIHKEAAIEIRIGKHTIRIGGMAKGSGMIHPDMATMLAYITTDAALAPQPLQKTLQIAVNQSFNCLSVDGETSTNDMVLLMANGLAGNPSFNPHTKEFHIFQSALTELCKVLALKVCQDGEGRTKVVLVQVKGAKSTHDAKRVAQAIVTSPLVKTAIFGEDPNWGRIMAAVGRAGVPVNPHAIHLHFNTVPIVKNGIGLGLIHTQSAKKIMQRSAFHITVTLGKGPGTYHFWTNDLTHDYITINTAYPS